MTILNDSPTSTRRARLLAFYLPQFHPTAENDEWWGKGFTEWTNVARSRPLFAGHRQPCLPADLGFYDLRLPAAREAQADLARRFGIEAFCYWHYWFEGRRLLERPFNEVLRSGEPDFPFCLAWANEPWSRRWLGEETDVLMAQTYSAQDDVLHARWLAEVFADHRNVRIHDRPVFVVYRPEDLPDPHRWIDVVKHESTRLGLAEPFLVGMSAHHEGDQRARGFDATLDWQPKLGIAGDPREPGLKLIDYTEATTRTEPTHDYPSFRTVLVGWDNSPRRGRNATVYTDSSPHRFEEALRRAADAVSDRPPDERLIWVNAWNEWAEGNHLEPDQLSGLGHLEALRRVVGTRAAGDGPVRRAVPSLDSDHRTR